MPRVARFRIAALDKLFDQLRYAPPEARVREMNAAERLMSELDPDQNYPHDFIIFRITGYRSEDNAAPVTLVGDALVGDLATFVLRLSESLELSHRFDGRTAVALEELAGRLNVARKTLQRYRKQGLVCHSLVFPDGERRLACFEDALERFTERNRKMLDRAAQFTRIDVGLRDQMIEQARALRHEKSASLSAAAQQIAQAYGRAHETIRLLLQDHDRHAADPIFRRRAPLTDHDERVIYRAAEAGVRVSVLSQRFGKTSSTIQRAINRQRGSLLRRFAIDIVVPESLPSDEVLATHTANHGFNAEPIDARRLLLSDSSIPAAEDAAVGELLEASSVLKARLVAAINDLPDLPAATQLDRIETDLRWLTRIKQRLLRIALPASFAAVERVLHRAPAAQPPDAVDAMLRVAVGTVVSTIDGFGGDAAAAGRLTKACRLNTDKALASRTDFSDDQNDDAPIDSLMIDSWQMRLELRASLAALLSDLDDDDKTLLETRFSLDGARPHTVEELASMRKTTTTNVARALRQTIRQLRRVRRERAAAHRD